MTRNVVHGISATLLLLMLPATVKAQFTYTTNNGAITITAYTGRGGDVTIPSMVDDMPITSIGVAAFYFKHGLTNVTIPDGVTNIGGIAFEGCSDLTSLTIPSSVTSIGGSAFWACSGLTSVTIPNGVTSIWGYTFNGCSGLTNVIIPGSVTSIGDCAFQGCTGLASVTIPNGITNVGSFAFSGCSMTNVIIPGTVTSIGASAFSGYSGLLAITVEGPNPSYLSIDGVLFDKSQTTLYICPSGKTGSYSIPPGVISIGTAAFSGCSGLTNVTIPSGVTSIGPGAFAYCSGLTSLTIPNSVTSIGGAFAGCSGLTSLTIPGSVTSIGDHTFDGCSGLASVTIPNSVTSIGDYAFNGCPGLTSLTIPGSVTSMGNYVFFYCTRLTAIYFLGGLPTLNNMLTFTACSAIVYHTAGAANWPAYDYFNPAVFTPSTPAFAQQPGSQTVRAGETSVFQAVISGTPPPTLQWRFNGQPLPGQTASTLSITKVTADQAGAYDLVATNAFGSATSQPAILSVQTNALDLALAAGFTAGQIQWQVYGISGRTYSLQYKDHLSDTNWTTLPPVAGTTGRLILSDTPGNTTQRFYRVLEQ